MIVTLFTDASFATRGSQRFATWAVWFKYLGNTWRYSGPVKGDCTEIGCAEMAAIANGIHLVVRDIRSLSATDRVIVQTDSMEAIGIVRGTQAAKRLMSKQARDYILKLREQSGFYIELRHVKGHKGAATKRNAVNTWCDARCRWELDRLLAKAEPEQEPEPKLDTSATRAKIHQLWPEAKVPQTTEGWTPPWE